MKYHYFVSDLDGTLLFKNTIKDTDIAAICKYVQEGNHFWVATGRGFDAYDILEPYALFPEEMVCSSGAVTCSSDKKPKYVSTICLEDAKHLFSFLKEKFPHLDYSIDCTDHSKRYAYTEAGNMFRHLPGTKKEVTTEATEVLNKKDVKIMRLFCVGDSNEYCAEVKNALEKEFDGRLKAMKTDETCIDIIPSDCGKWHALKTLLDEKQIDKQFVATIGDQETDIEMIQNCGIGFAMNTADEKVQNAADYVVSSVREAFDILRNL